MNVIKSRDNPKIKYAIKLSKSTSFRKEEKCFFASSIKIVDDLISYGFLVESVFIAIDLYEKYTEILPSEKVFVITNEVEEKLNPEKSSQSVFAVFKMRETDEKDLFSKEKLLILEDLQDPQNVGAIMRTALAFGYKDVVISDKTADIYSTKVLRSSMTASVKLNIYKISDFEKLTKELNQNKFTTIAACLEDAKDLKEVQKPIKPALFIGNEGKGLSKSVLDNSLLKVKIEMDEDIESLNAAVSGAVLMWEFK